MFGSFADLVNGQSPAAPAASAPPASPAYTSSSAYAPPSYMREKRAVPTATYVDDPMEVIDEDVPSAVVTEALALAGQPPTLVASLAETNITVERTMRAWIKNNAPGMWAELEDAEAEFDIARYLPPNSPRYRAALEKVNAKRDASKRMWTLRMSPHSFALLCRLNIQKYENAPPGDAGLEASQKAQLWRTILTTQDRDRAYRSMT
jgi:hypothetical protein